MIRLRLLLVLFLMPMSICAMDEQANTNRLITAVAENTSISREELQQKADEIAVALQTEFQDRATLISKLKELKPVLEGRLRFRLIDFFIKSTKSKLTPLERFNMAVGCLQDPTESKERQTAVLCEVSSLLYSATQMFYPFSDKVIAKISAEHAQVIKNYMLKMPKFGLIEKYSSVDLKATSLHDLLYYLQICRFIEQSFELVIKFRDFCDAYIGASLQDDNILEIVKKKRPKITPQQHVYITDLIRQVKKCREDMIAIGFPDKTVVSQEDMNNICGGWLQYINKESNVVINLETYNHMLNDKSDDKYTFINFLEIVDNESQIKQLCSELSANTDTHRDDLRKKAIQVAQYLQDPFPGVEELIERVINTGSILDGRLRFRLLDFFISSKESKLCSGNRLKLAAKFLGVNISAEKIERFTSVKEEVSDLLYQHPADFAPCAKQYDIERILGSSDRDSIKKLILEKEDIKLLQECSGIDLTYMDMSLLLYYLQLHRLLKKELKDAADFEVLAQQHRDAMLSDSYVTRSHVDQVRKLTEVILENKEQLKALGFPHGPLVGSKSNFNKLCGGTTKVYAKKFSNVTLSDIPEKVGKDITERYTELYNTLITREGYTNYIEFMKKRIRD